MKPAPGMLLLTVLMAALPCAAAQAPSPLRPDRFAFPGDVAAPASAISAGLALADRWLGEEPFDNPAAAPQAGLLLAPVLQRVSRQDLRAKNRNFAEQSAFFDGAGARLAFPVGRLGVSLYAHQPVLRLEDNSYTQGEAGGPVQPAALTSRASAREVRAGLAISFGIPALRLGVAGEWVRREDSYETTEQSGSPDQGKRTVDFSGNAVGFQAGARLERGGPDAGALTVGVAIRHQPALRVEGTGKAELLSDTSEVKVSAERAVGWQYGAAARYAVTPTLRLLLAAGGRTASEWKGFGVTSGASAQWSLGGEFHDPATPWSVRFGVGQEIQAGVPEPRAGLVALGFGWRLESTLLDLGVVHRSLTRAGQPNSYDDRVVGSVTVEF